MIAQVKLKDKELLYKANFTQWTAETAFIGLDVSDNDGETWDMHDPSLIKIDETYSNIETFVLNYLRELHKGEALEITTRIHTRLGDFYISPDMTDGGISFVLLDSDKEYIANCYNPNTLDVISDIKDIYDLVNTADIGINMIYGESEMDCYQEFEAYATGCGNDDDLIIAEIRERDLPINRVGYNYFILDYTEI